MSRLVFLLEERSMKTLLENLLPRLIPGLRFICVPDEGKHDLQKAFQENFVRGTSLVFAS